MKRIIVVSILATLAITSPAHSIALPKHTSAMLHGSPLYATVPIAVVEQMIVQTVQSVEPVVQSAPSIPTCASLNTVPAVGQSCSLPIATTDYSLPTSVVQDPGTLGFTSMPTAGSSTYTPTVAAGTAAPVAITASGACSMNEGSVSVSGSGTCTITASQSGADTIQQVFVVTGEK
jgi:hypothetical protein